MRLKQLLLLTVIFALAACSGEKHQLKTKADSNGLTYEYVTNDPVKGRIYTLENGLKIFLSVNKDEPRVQTYLGVRAGSTSDPIETTGLAHYFEHMMFKGTNKIGTLNWEKESKLIAEISDLFEKRKEASTQEEKDMLYSKIDSVSQIAATFAAANEYDKLVSTLGAKGTNAGTSLEQTVYINDIPSNEIEKWMKLESERFSNIVLRLFHTELETVYEEYNMYQDRDGSRAYATLSKALFPSHPYGRSVIGLAEHLKNPSMVNIHQFADTYYVPNNMVLSMSGDIDMDETMQLVQKYFGVLKENKDLPKRDKIVEKPLDGPIIKEVYGPDAEFLQIAFRFEQGKNSQQEKVATMVDYILSNSKAGLIDLNLNQKQEVLFAGSGANFLKDYGYHSFYGGPRQGQTLEQVKDLLLEQLELVKKGEFEEWILKAIVNDLRLNEMRRLEQNSGRVSGYMEAFVNEFPYKETLTYLDELEKITKEEIVTFANEYYKNNYVVVYKKIGDPQNKVKVDKPKMTAIEINREDQSDFFNEFVEVESERLKPVFLDYEKEIITKKFDNGIEFNYIENPNNEVFTLQYILDMGKNHDLKTPLAVNYLKYLGTDKYSAEELQKEMYKYGLSYNVSASDKRCYISISGLEKSVDKGVEMLEHIISNVKPDKDAYKNYVDGILKGRLDSKKSAQNILWGGLFNYGKYGPNSSFTNILSEEELSKIDPSELTEKIKNLTSFKHRMFYYGQKTPEQAMEVISKYHIVPETLNDYPTPMEFMEKETNESVVYLVNYDMVQANIVMLAKDQKFDKELLPESRLFSEYFGGGLSSIVFQEIRESRALAYSAFSAFSTPSTQKDSHYVYGFVGTQADKLEIATNALLDLMNEMPRSDKQFELAKESIIKKIETERIIKTSKFWNYQSNLDKGIDYDIRKDVYETMKDISWDEFNAFFEQHISGKNYTYLVVGNKETLDMNVLGRLGTVKELTLEEVFNY